MEISDVMYCIFFIVTLLFSILLNSIFLKFVKTLGIRSHTDTIIRWNSQSKPALGGISFYVIFLLSIIFYAIFWEPGSLIKNKQMLGVIIACTIGFLMGLADDAYNTKPFLKFLAQLLCAIVFIYTDTYISFFDNQLLNYFLTAFWVIGIMNSINMLDNMDAITTCVSTIIVSGVLAILYLSNNYNNVLFLLLLGTLSSLIGFLFFNWYPSKMFMGDTGSQFIGVLLSAVGIIFFWNLPYSIQPEKSSSKQIIVILLAFIIPIIDTTTVVINRLLKKKSPFIGGKDHTTHHLFYFGISERKIALLFSLISIISLMLAIFIMRQISEWNYFYIVLFSSFFFLAFISLYVTTRLKNSANEDINANNKKYFK